tara:strand:- start:702 stop:1244 length:543 start_codon:yes stop_codon:yes gene_type:complete
MLSFKQYLYEMARQLKTDEPVDYAPQKFLDNHANKGLNRVREIDHNYDLYAHHDTSNADFPKTYYHAVHKATKKSHMMVSGNHPDGKKDFYVSNLHSVDPKERTVHASSFYDSISNHHNVWSDLTHTVAEGGHGGSAVWQRLRKEHPDRIHAATTLSDKRLPPSDADNNDRVHNVLRQKG